MQQDRFVFEGRDIACSQIGSGPPVVLVHGTPFSSHVWSRYAAELSSRYTVHTWDLPGYGESSMHPEHAVDFGVHAQVFAALIDHWGISNPHVIAHDIGGGVALRTHLVEGVSFNSLLLLDAVAVPPVGSLFFKFIAEQPRVLEQLPAYIHESIVRAYINGASYQGLPPARLEELMAPWIGDIGQSAFYRQIASLDESFLIENERLLSNMRMPVRVLWGAEDAWLPVAAGVRLHGLINGAEWRTIEEAGHLVPYDTPVALTHEITTWLAAQTT